MFQCRKYFVLIAFMSFLVATSCKKKKSNELVRTSKECVAFILKQDDSLGSVRNHSCKKISLSKTIKEYTSNLNKLDFSNCPTDFSEAFNYHITAWNEMIKVTDKYPELRGEMHDLFDIIEKGKDSSQFKTNLKAIWNTWKPIENAKKTE